MFRLYVLFLPSVYQHYRFVAIPEADVQWYHNKVELKESKRVTIQHQVSNL